ncbi:DUF362 domain-containing protein [Thermodesulfobacteriota bacterium]
MQNKKRWITRRDFMRGSVGAVLGASLFGVKWTFGDSNNTRSSVVTVVRDEKVMNATGSNIDTKILKKMLDQTVIHATGENNIKDAWNRIVKPDDMVGIVPSRVHHEMIEVLEASLVDVGIPKNKIIEAQGLPSFSKVETCTALIALPTLKSHLATGIGTVMKNYIMFSGRPMWYHGHNSVKLGEIWHLPEVKGKTRLVLVDALFPLCDRGPQVNPRYRWGYNGLIAGTDPVAVEAVCLHILEEKRATLKGRPWPISPPSICLEAADKVYKLGTSNLDEITINLVGWEKDHLLPI